MAEPADNVFAFCHERGVRPTNGRSMSATPEAHFVGTILFEQNDEYAVQRCRYMTLETIALLSNECPTRLSAAVACRPKWANSPGRPAEATPRPGG